VSSTWNGYSTIAVSSTHSVPQLISPVAGLFFLSLGTQPPTADWGSTLATGLQFVFLSPHVVLLRGLAIFAIVLALSLVGDALRGILDPRTYSR
jgi:peptide/nickel transport system permease protein